jgi:hypothetical protein
MRDEVSTIHVTVASDEIARKRDTAMSTLLSLAAILEAATGLALMIHPALVAEWLFGDVVSGVGVALSRVAGVALLALGVACWPDREAGSGVISALRAMLTYSLLVTIYLAYLGGVEHLAGMLLWPAVVVHVVFVLLLVAAWREDRRREGGPTP